MGSSINHVARMVGIHKLYHGKGNASRLRSVAWDFFLTFSIRSGRPIFTAIGHPSHGPREDWSATPYGECEEEIPSNAPEPRGIAFTMR